ncbi:uncharacterized protein C8R40DRAFT_1074463 [Lentinula edodes]|uniref:uncharacterized protein n=1 Tax=Lentinula edodes TaxID=5353 RepID=UPI001E8E2131|nr:uncharacterized protein C8R40DRAFT_1074463 [Lentinula edodes]KAH7868840.1 hypothetical protein C8R40DRAFT_1074463 [Lentinula edodes]
MSSSAGHRTTVHQASTSIAISPSPTSCTRGQGSISQSMIQLSHELHNGCLQRVILRSLSRMIDPMNIIPFLCLFLYIPISLAHPPPSHTLDFAIDPTITVGQSFPATWGWNGLEGSISHSLIVMVGQKITTTSTASPGVKTGVMQLQVSESGSYQATLTMMFQGTTTSLGQTNAIGYSISSPTTSGSFPPAGGGITPPLSMQPMPTVPASSAATSTYSNTQSNMPPPTPTTSQSNIVGVILGTIFGSLSACLLFAILAYCIWQRRSRRRTLPRRNTLSNLSSKEFYPDRMTANAFPSIKHFPGQEVDEGNWDAHTESSLTPSDSASRVVWSFSQGKKARPLATSTTLTVHTEESVTTAANDNGESKSDVTTESGRYSSANADLPFKIPTIMMTAATPSPPSTTVS